MPLKHRSSGAGSRITLRIGPLGSSSSPEKDSNCYSRREGEMKGGGGSEGGKKEGSAFKRSISLSLRQ